MFIELWLKAENLEWSFAHYGRSFLNVCKVVPEGALGWCSLSDYLLDLRDTKNSKEEEGMWTGLLIKLEMSKLEIHPPPLLQRSSCWTDLEFPHTLLAAASTVLHKPAMSSRGLCLGAQCTFLSLSMRGICWFPSGILVPKILSFSPWFTSTCRAQTLYLTALFELSKYFSLKSCAI